MEHFEGQQQQVKQKNVYLLHLDAPRIVLISAVIIGVIVGSFLIGMNFVKSSGELSPASMGQDMVSNNGSSGVFDAPIPAPPHSGDAEGSEDGELFSDKTGADKIDDAVTVHAKNESVDILTSDAINEIIPPSVQKKSEISKSATKQVIQKKPSKALARKSATVQKKAEQKNIKSAKSSSQTRTRIVPVSTREPDKRTVSRDLSGFSVQVASYDKRGRASKEIDRLKKMNFDAYLDSSFVNGKKYYRVRIGPLSTQGRAQSLLKEIQGHERYGDSYIIKQ